MNQVVEKKTHTTGPWEVQITDVNFCYIQSPITKETICRVYVEDYDDTEGEANANLLATAPELLEEVKRLRSVILARGIVDESYRTDRIIKKATGE